MSDKEEKGYRDTDTLIFQNETLSVGRKAETHYAELRRRSISDEQPLNHRRGRIDPGGTHANAPWYLQTDLVTTALSYFVNRHITNTTFSYLQHFHPIVQNDNMVQDAMSACALVCFGRYSEQARGVVMARGYYCRALVSVRQAISVPEMVTENATLLCLLLLSHFEAITFSGRVQPTDWTHHVYGLSTLLSLRNETQFEDEFGQKLFSHASIQVLTHSIQQAAPVPSNLKHLQRHASTILGLKHFGVVFGRLLSDAATLRATMEGKPTTELVREALRLDEKTQELLEKAKLTALQTGTSYPPNTNNQALPHSNTENFRSLNDLRQCNNIQLLRICFQGWIFDVFEPGIHRNIADQPIWPDPLCDIWWHLKVNAALEFQKLAESILASVPVFISLQGEPPYPANRFMLCPLVIVATSRMCTSTLKRSVLHALEIIGVGYDMDQVKDVLRLLERGQSLENWYDYDLLS